MAEFLIAVRANLLWVVLAFTVIVPTSVAADTPSPALVRAIQAAVHQANDGDVAGARQALLDLRYSLPAGDRISRQAVLERAMLSFYAGRFSQMLDEHETALALHLEAARGFRMLGEDFLSSLAMVMEFAASSRHSLSEPRAAYDLLMEARELRRRSGALTDDGAVQAMRFAAALALELRDPELVVAEVVATAGLVFGHSDHVPPLVSAQAAAQAAQLATWLGAYPMASVAIETMAQKVSAIALDLMDRTPDREPQRVKVCNELSHLVRESVGLRIDHGDYGGAHALHQQLARYLTEPFFCGGVIAPQATLLSNSLMARLFLHVGDPFSAHLRLLAYEDGVPDSGLAQAERARMDAIVKVRRAEARLMLGFIGEAGTLLADIAANKDPLPQHETFERERLLAVALQARLDGRLDAALDALADAEALMTARAPYHWFARGEIAFRRALIHIERGRPGLARATRERFEAELAELIAAQRDIGQQMNAVLAARGNEAAPHPAPMPGESRPESPAFRALDRMRMLFDLSMAAHHGDDGEVEAAFERAAAVGLPASVGLADHAQRAYLLGCLRAKGAGLECSLTITQAFAAPAGTPLPCVGGCPIISSEAQHLVVNGDMIRNQPLIARFAEPVLAWLIREADAAREASGDRAFDEAAGRWQGAGLAFELAQRMVEGGAATAVEQIASRLAAGSGEVAELMRQRQQTGAAIDLLFRDGEADPGEMARLAERLRHLQDRLAALRPDLVDLFRPQPMSVEEISTLLPDGATMLMIASTGEATYVFAVRDGKLAWHRAPVGAVRLAERVAHLRASLDPDAPDRGAAPLTGRSAPAGRSFDRTAAHAIYRDLVGPIAPFLVDEELQAVVQGPLAALPLSVLVRSAPQGADDDPAALRATDWLARAHPLTLLPSPAALRLARLQHERPRAAAAFIGFGDPEFSGPEGGPFARLPALPGTRAEIRRLATLLGSGQDDMFLGSRATKAAILDADLSRARVLAFATHGLLAGQMPDATEPGLVFSHPAPGAGMGESYLTASEAATLKINADWVLLSACNTAGSDGRPDSEGLSGLARAFLFAGARSVLVSYWPVRDDAAMLLTTGALGWHAQHPAASRAAALRHAVLSLLSREDAPDFSHPSAWAPFVLLGDG